MKNIQHIVFAAIICGVLLLSFTGCKDKEESDAFMIATGLIVAPSDTTFSTFQVASSSSNPWTVTSDQTWCTVSPATGVGDAMVTATMSPNPIAVGREAKLTVTTDGITKDIVVKQNGAAPVVTLSASTFMVTDAAGSSSVAITSNGPWTAAVNNESAGWCTVNPSSAQGDTTFTISYTTNATLNQRLATITVTAGTLTKTITLTQDVGDLVLKVTPSSVDIKQTATSFPITISIAGTWTADVSPSAPWCTLDAASGAGRTIVTVTATALTSDDQRVAIITVTSGSMVQTVKVTQAHYFTDTRDGQSYKMVKMPDGKWWMAENLRYTKDLTYNAYTYLANGATIPSGTGSVPAGYTYLAIGSYWCNGRNDGNTTSQGPYNNNAVVCATYGAIYAWETAMMLDGKWSDNTRSSSTWDESWVSGNYYPPASVAGGATANNARGTNNQGIAPPGWHIPTDAEWAIMLDAVEGNGTGTGYQNQSGPTSGSGDNFASTVVDAGKKLKTTAMCTSGSNCNTDSTAIWNFHATNGGTDVYGFGALPSGYRNGGVTTATFLSRGDKAYYWTSSVSNSSSKGAFSRVFTAAQAKAGRSLQTARTGAAVRCVKN